MDEQTKHIVASNLTAAYFSGMKRYLKDPNEDAAVNPQERKIQMEQPFLEVYGVYRGFLQTLNERYPTSPDSDADASD